MEKGKKKERKINKRVLAGSLSILAALLFTFVFSPLYNRAVEEKCSVIRITKYVPEGKRLTEADIETVTIGKFNLASEVYTEKEAVIGKYAMADLMPGDYIVTGKVSEEPISANGYLWDLSDHRRAVSISVVGFAEGLSGKLEQGDIVSIVATEKRTEEADLLEERKQETTTYIPKELTYLEVLAVTASNGTDSDAQKIAQNNEYDDTNLLPASITVAVTEEQLIRLVALEENGSIHIALAYRGEDAASYLELQKSLLEES